MKCFSLYETETGKLLGKQVRLSDSSKLKLSAGVSAIEGPHDHLSNVVKDGIVVPCETIKSRHDFSDLVSELSELDSKAVRYLIEFQEETIDEEGRKRYAAILGRKAEIRAILQTVSK